MNSQIAVIGISHRTASLPLRERYAVPLSAAAGRLADVRRDARVEEALILSTCQRVEWYAAGSAVGAVQERLAHAWASQGAGTTAPLATPPYLQVGEAAVRHLLRVATGLDSVVVGEGQVLQQVKTAYEAARACHATGKALNVLFQRALHTAKLVRSRTSLGTEGLSMGSLAAEYVKRACPAFDRSTVVLVGSGKVGEAVLYRLTRQANPACMQIFSRRLDHAEALARRYHASASPIEALPRALEQADAAILSTGASEFLLTAEQMARVLRRRAHAAPLLLIDLGMPRNVAPAVAALPGVHLLTLDELAGLVQALHPPYRSAVRQAEAIIDAQARRFMAWLAQEQGQAWAGRHQPVPALQHSPVVVA